MRLERRDRDAQPIGERQGGEQTVELRLAVGTVQPDRRCSVTDERPSPEPNEVPVLRELGRGGGLGALASLDLLVRCAGRNLDLELDQELSSSRHRHLRGDELEESAVDLLGVRPGDVVRAALDGDERAIGDQRRQPRGGRVEREDPVLGAVHDEHGDVDLRQVSAEVGQPGVDARVGRERGRAGGDVEARLPGTVADAAAAEDIDVVEVVEEVLEDRRSGP